MRRGRSLSGALRRRGGSCRPPEMQSAERAPRHRVAYRSGAEGAPALSRSPVLSRWPVVVVDDRELRSNTALVEVSVEAALDRSAGHQLWIGAAGNELCPIAADAENVCGICLGNRDPPARLNCSHT